MECPECGRDCLWCVAINGDEWWQCPAYDWRSDQKDEEGELKS